MKDFFFSGSCILLNIKHLEYKQTLKTHHSFIFSLGNRGWVVEILGKNYLNSKKTRNYLQLLSGILAE